MKYCPTCETRYDEDILRFCMKDGTPLVDEAEPTFIQMPSESVEAAAPVEDEPPEEITVIRRNVPVPPPLPSAIEDDEDFGAPREAPERIVVPTYERQRQREQARVPRYQAPPPQRANTVLVVVLTIIGTVGVLTVAIAAAYFFANGGKKNTNANANLADANTSLNTNLAIDTNFNFNAGVAVPNINTNANLKTPTPTPTPTPRPSPSPTVSPTPDDDNGLSNDNVNSRPRVSPTPPPSPRATATPPPSNRPPVNGGVLNGRAVSLSVPLYPPLARSVGASGQVTVQVSVDERGNVISARALTGHPLLRAAAEQAARSSRIAPTRIGDQNVKTTGVLLYNFRNN